MLKLYQREQCPYCARVREKLTEMEATYICVNVPRERPLREEVIKISGQEGIPVLVDGDKVIFDSEKILAYLDTL